ncbi:MAG: transposase [Saprospiraceae bacterium]|nr:transposase [Saprospiraceae bacterium]
MAEQNHFSQFIKCWIDAIHYKIRQDGKVVSKAALIVLGIDLEGKQDILALHIIK